MRPSARRTSRPKRPSCIFWGSNFKVAFGATFTLGVILMIVLVLVLAYALAFHGMG